MQLPAASRPRREAVVAQHVRLLLAALAQGRKNLGENLARPALGRALIHEIAQVQQEIDLVVGSNRQSSVASGQQSVTVPPRHAGEGGGVVAVSGLDVGDDAEPADPRWRCWR